MKLFRVFLFFVLTSTLLFSSVTLLKKVELQKGELRLHFNQLYDKKQIKHFTLKKPFREVFDIKNSRLASKRVGSSLHSSHCQSIRISQYKRNTVRVVIETGKYYSCTPYKPLFAWKSYHIPLPKFTVKKRRTVNKKHSVKSKKVLKSKKEKPYLIVTNQKKRLKKNKRDLVVIDAGHGGHDTGAIGGGKREKDLVLQIAKKVAKEIKKRGYSVYLTRSTNRFLKLSQRTRIADKKGSVAFISIHANSVPKRHRMTAHGVETFFLQNTRDAKSQRIATRENAAVLKGAGSRLSKKVIIDSVLNGPKIVQSNKLAIDVQRRIITNLRRYYRGVRDGGVRHAPFYVLVGASRPSILVEVGYISNPKERKRLFTQKYQKLIAKGIAEGLDNYLNNRKKEIDIE